VGDTVILGAYVLSRPGMEPRIVGKRVHDSKPQYLVKWVGYGHGRNMWRGLDDLQGCKELVADYDEKQEQLATARAQQRTRRAAGQPEWSAPTERPARRQPARHAKETG